MNNLEAKGVEREKAIVNGFATRLTVEETEQRRGTKK
jgi:hypothetical protein